MSNEREEIIGDTCPECGTNLFVYGCSANEIDYVCEACGTRFNYTDGEIEVIDREGEGPVAVPEGGSVETGSSARQPQG